MVGYDNELILAVAIRNSTTGGEARRFLRAEQLRRSIAFVFEVT